MNPLLPAAVAIVIPAVAIADTPPIFTKLSFEEAKQQAAKEGKLLVVDSMADWCPPCKKMDKTTWVDEKTVAFFKDNAIAFQFDVDEDSELAQSLKIEAMPTMIVFKDGKEIDRSVGYMSTSELISWLENVKEGRTNAVMLAEEARKIRDKAGDRAGPDGKVNIRERMDIARRLSGTDPDLAAQEYAWLWENMLDHEPHYVGVRVSFMVSEMKQLAQEHEVAKTQFTKLRDEAETKLKNRTATRQTLEDWIHLNRVLDDDDRTLAWYDRVKDKPEAARDIKRNEHILRGIFEEKKRWADMGRMYKSASAEARGIVQQGQLMTSFVKGEDAEMMKEFALEHVRRELGKMHAALLAAGRDADAAKVVEILIEYSDTPESRRELVNAALEAGQARESHLDLLADDDSLRLEVKAALRGAR
jgi:thioredoxin 1